MCDSILYVAQYVHNALLINLHPGIFKMNNEILMRVFNNWFAVSSFIHLVANAARFNSSYTSRYADLGSVIPEGNLYLGRSLSENLLVLLANLTGNLPYFQFLVTIRITHFSSYFRKKTTHLIVVLSFQLLRKQKGSSSI